jgi:GT2 family glycosyltransferase
VVPRQKALLERKAVKRRETVSAVVPHWNRAALLQQVLADLAAQTHPLETVIVVDNGSTDRSPEVAEHAGARVIRLPRNEGFARAVNIGVGACTSDWVLIVNNDVSFGPEWLAALSTAAAAAQASFAIGKLTSAGDPSTIDGTWDAVCRGAVAWRCGNGRPDGPLWDDPRSTPFIPLTAALVRRDLFTQLGPLDETFESYLEDVDFGLRCAAAGRTGIYVPEARARHAGSATLGAWHKATVRRLARNQVLLVRKHFRGAPVWPVLAAQLLWGLLAFRHGAGWAWLRGSWEGRRFPPPAAAGEWDHIRAVVEKSEAEILQLQRLTGFDWYWRMYFALVRN